MQVLHAYTMWVSTKKQGLESFGVDPQILVATESCEIYEVLDSDGTNLHRGPMVQGHFGHGVRGLAVHPSDPDQFASAGADRTIRIWNRSERTMVGPTPSQKPSLSLALSRYMSKATNR